MWYPFVREEWRYSVYAQQVDDVYAVSIDFSPRLTRSVVTNAGQDEGTISSLLAK